MRKIVIAGGSGFIGRGLSQHFAAAGDQVIVLSRKHHLDEGNIRFVKWDGKTYGAWNRELEGSEVLINLNGKSVDCRYNEKNKQAIYDTRIDSTFILGEAIQLLKHPPKVWLNAASATIYTHSVTRPMSECHGKLGRGFSVDVCRKWERTFFEAETPGVRKIAMRMALVLGKHGGALGPLDNLVRAGLGGAQAGGDQMMSWIHEEDLFRAIDYLIENREIEGEVNISAPNPVNNAEFMRTLRKTRKIPWGIPCPKPLVSLGAFLLSTEDELVLKSRYVVPGVLLKNDFEFEFPELSEALNHLLIGRKASGVKEKSGGFNFKLNRATA